MSASVINLIVMLGNATVIPALAWAARNKRPLGVAVLLAALPLLSLGRRLSVLRSLPLSLETLAVLALVFFWATRDRGEAYTPPHSGHSPEAISTFLLSTTFLLTSLLSTMLRGNDPVPSLNILVAGGLAPLLMYSMSSRLHASKTAREYTIAAVMLIAIQAAVYTLVMGGRVDIQFSRALELTELQQLYGGQATSITNLFAVPSVTLAVIVMSVPLAAWYMTYGHHYPQLLGWATLLSVLFVGISSFSRGSWIGIFVAVVGSLPLFFRRTAMSRVLIVALIILAVFNLGIADYAGSIFDFRSDYSLSATIRLSNYKLAVSSARRFPLVGLGLGNYRNIYSAFPAADASHYPPLIFAHSLLLTLIPEIGLLGAIAFAVLIIRSLSHGVRYASKHYGPDKDTSMVYALVIAALSYLTIASTSGAHLVASLTSGASAYFVAPALIVLFTLLGAIDATTREQRLVSYVTSHHIADPVPLSMHLTDATLPNTMPLEHQGDVHS